MKKLAKAGKFLFRFVAFVALVNVAPSIDATRFPPTNPSDDFWLQTIASSPDIQNGGSKATASLEVIVQAIRSHGRVCQPREIVVRDDNAQRKAGSSGEETDTWVFNKTTGALHVIRTPAALPPASLPQQKLNTTLCVKVNATSRQATDWNYCDISWSYSLAVGNTARHVNSGSCSKSIDCQINKKVNLQDLTVSNDTVELSLEAVTGQNDGVGNDTSTKIGSFVKLIDLNAECGSLSQTGMTQTAPHVIVLTDPSCIVPPELTVLYRLKCFAAASGDGSKTNRPVGASSSLAQSPDINLSRPIAAISMSFNVVCLFFLMFLALYSA